MSAFDFFCIFDPKNRNSMIHYITEKDFVPEYVYQSQKGKNEIERGLYQIVYGVLLNKLNYNSIYDLIVRISKEQKYGVVKRFMLKAWRKEVDAIIKKLNALDIKDKKVIVFNPFTHYYKDVPYTKNRFELVIDIIDEILVNGDAQMEISKNPKYDYPIGCFEQFVGNYRLELEKNLIQENSNKIEYYRELIFDEMIRRGTTRLTKAPFWEREPKTGKLHIVVRQIKIAPSKYYKQPNKLFELDNYFEEYKLLKVGMKEETEISNSSNGSDDKVNDKEKTGILYYMLKELTQETNEKRWKKKAASLISYILSSLKADTVRRYIDQVGKLSKNDMGARFYETVDKVLGECGFTVPQEIKDGLPQKKHKQLD